VIAIITITTAVFTPIFVSYLTVGEVFRGYPEYEVSAELLSSDAGDFSKLTITNMGSVQAKNSKNSKDADSEKDAKNSKAQTTVEKIPTTFTPDTPPGIDPPKPIEHTHN